MRRVHRRTLCRFQSASMVSEAAAQSTNRVGRRRLRRSVQSRIPRRTAVALGRAHLAAASADRARDLAGRRTTRIAAARGRDAWLREIESEAGGDATPLLQSALGVVDEDAIRCLLGHLALKIIDGLMNALDRLRRREQGRLDCWRRVLGDARDGRQELHMVGAVRKGLTASVNAIGR